jgi:hypothetical protein
MLGRARASSKPDTEASGRLDDISRSISMARQKLLGGKQFTPLRSQKLVDFEDQLKQRRQEKSEERKAKILNIYAALGTVGAKLSAPIIPPRKDQQFDKKKGSFDASASSSSKFISSKRAIQTPDFISKTRADNSKTDEDRFANLKSKVKITDVLKKTQKTPEPVRRYIEEHHQVPHPDPKYKEHYGTNRQTKYLFNSNMMQAETGSTASKVSTQLSILSSHEVSAQRHLNQQPPTKSRERIFHRLKDTKDRLSTQNDNVASDLKDFKPTYHSHLSDLLKAKDISFPDTKAKTFYGQSLGTYTNSMLKPDTSYFERILAKDYLTVSGQTGNLKDSAFALFLDDCRDQVRILRQIEDEIALGEHYRPQMLMLPMSLKTRCLFVDLDETLVRTEKEVPGKKYDEVVSITASDGQTEVGVS